MVRSTMGSRSATLALLAMCVILPADAFRQYLPTGPSALPAVSPVSPISPGRGWELPIRTIPAAPHGIPKFSDSRISRQLEQVQALVSARTQQNQNPAGRPAHPTWVLTPGMRTNSRMVVDWSLVLNIPFCFRHGRWLTLRWRSHGETSSRRWPRRSSRLPASSARPSASSQSRSTPPSL